MEHARDQGVDLSDRDIREAVARKARKRAHEDNAKKALEDFERDLEAVQYTFEILRSFPEVSPQDRRETSDGGGTTPAFSDAEGGAYAVARGDQTLEEAKQIFASLWGQEAASVASDRPPATPSEEEQEEVEEPEDDTDLSADQADEALTEADTSGDDAADAVFGENSEEQEEVSDDTDTPADLHDELAGETEDDEVDPPSPDDANDAVPDSTPRQIGSVECPNCGRTAKKIKDGEEVFSDCIYCQEKTAIVEEGGELPPPG